MRVEGCTDLKRRFWKSKMMFLTFIIIAYEHTEPPLLKKKLPGLISDATLIL